MADDPTIFEQLPVGAWKVGNGRPTIYFAVVDVDEDGGNRLVRRARPYRDGEKIDDTGSKAKEWNVTIAFHNGVAEGEGLPNPAGQTYYPGILNDLIDSFDIHETGDLTLPTRGTVRVRAETYGRHEDFSQRDYAVLKVKWVRDNEDAIDASSFTNPTVRATLGQAVDETVFGMEALGGFSAFLADLEDAATNLQDAIAAPGEFVADVDQKAARVARIASDVENQFLVSAQFGRDLLTDPDAWATIRQLRILQDRTARAAFEKTSPIAPIVTAVLQSAQSIFELAAQLAQDPTDLAAINGHIEDLFLIPAGAVVNIFQPAVV